MNPEELETCSSSIDIKNTKKKNKQSKHKEKKHKKKKKKHKFSDSEHEIQKRVKSKRKKSKHKKQKEDKVSNDDKHIPGPSASNELIISAKSSRAPMTKEEWEKSQNIIKRVYDETGRSRLIKGDGEILEEIVSKEKHKEINRQATLGDGLYFQNKISKIDGK